jgi:hypothetical protein
MPFAQSRVTIDYNSRKNRNKALLESHEESIIK